MEKHNDTDDSSIPIRIPVKFVVAVISGVLLGGMGLNTALFKASPSTEYAELTKIVTLFGEQVTQHGHQITTAHSQIEALRTDIRERTSGRFTDEEAEVFRREQDRKHAELEKTDAQAQRAIDALEREVDAMKAR